MKLNRRNKATPEFSLAAMVDVILLLLIFFMVTSAAANMNAIDVKLPKADVAEMPRAAEVYVSVKEDGSFYINDVPVSTDQVEQTLLNALADSGKKEFIIRGDENARHKDIVSLMEIAEKNKLGLSIATAKE